ncbi:MAG: tRNA preQ1(34) S-adenosylmethionine ribosyltransferase-isomerase QueA [Deltaproteobacteria bacterium]|nr:tRNA preQ1(34) S-adenosylmethionine ribosyltransferase-isomerase QueA [Deltaproteobacteria bacterium]MBW1961990.1 tRNA preQ1(34) S-adenosylmethionine ribosyltransferase-isomerase QueA [Deltaproteobacteria bacterium]MBW1993420.1 tRNA preQ1(34) S-adenosylmethionine ribosyltransferase-isomerase QueA [Deltaproteobacteria bacterium]MBW2153907.1 tRNA preQ1(34) S-adenosylmethionine ribosyltransferase-isomerase QueA [Deltaproteobacteria bacterium]
MYALSDYDYDLPRELIAQQPAAERDQSRLLVLDRKTGRVSHRRFKDFCELVRPSDILVLNNTEVIPGRLIGRKETGGRVQLLIIDYASRQKNKNDSAIVCKCLIKASKRPRKGTRLVFKKGLSAEVMDFEKGIFTVKFFWKEDFEDLLYQIGDVPLPPYIKRRDKADDHWRDDRTAYQTVYASRKGAVAAPTAGLHFTDRMLLQLRDRDIKIAYITLHVGYGTFLPVRASDIRFHKMHEEWFEVSEAAAQAINRVKRNGGRVVAVGTTSVRTLEFAADEDGLIKPQSGYCDLFIYPGYRFKVVDAMLTNFHLPKSTILMLVSAFAGRTAILNAYQEAIRERYRFYSYGDAMFIA